MKDNICVKREVLGRMLPGEELHGVEVCEPEPVPLLCYLQPPWRDPPLTCARAGIPVAHCVISGAFPVLTKPRKLTGHSGVS